MPPIQMHFNWIGLTSLAAMYILLAPPFIFWYVREMSPLVELRRANEMHYYRRRQSSLSDWLDPLMLLVGMAWVTAGFFLWIVLSLLYCELTPERACQPFEHIIQLRARYQ